jgi:hypothetical protein
MIRTGSEPAFPLAVAAIRNVPSMLDKETKGSRTDAFRNWWKGLESDALFQFVPRIRNAEFKEGVDTKAAHVEIGVEDSITIGVGEDAPTRPLVSVRPATVRASWRFQETGEEVLGLLHRYLDRLRDEIIPTAERLTA